MNAEDALPPSQHSIDLPSEIAEPFARAIGASKHDIHSKGQPGGLARILLRVDWEWETETLKTFDADGRESEQEVRAGLCLWDHGVSMHQRQMEQASLLAQALGVSCKIESSPTPGIAEEWVSAHWCDSKNFKPQNHPEGRFLDKSRKNLGSTARMDGVMPDRSIEPHLGIDEIQDILNGAKSLAQARQEIEALGRESDTRRDTRADAKAMAQLWEGFEPVKEILNLYASVSQARNGKWDSAMESAFFMLCAKDLPNGQNAAVALRECAGMRAVPGVNIQDPQTLLSRSEPEARGALEFALSRAPMRPFADALGAIDALSARDGLFTPKELASAVSRLGKILSQEQARANSKGAPAAGLGLEMEERISRAETALLKLDTLSLMAKGKKPLIPAPGAKRI